MRKKEKKMTFIEFSFKKWYFWAMAIASTYFTFELGLFFPIAIFFILIGIFAIAYRFYWLSSREKEKNKLEVKESFTEFSFKKWYFWGILILLMYYQLEDGALTLLRTFALWVGFFAILYVIYWAGIYFRNKK